MRNTIRKVTIVVLVLITSCQVSENRNTGPSSAHTTMTARAQANAPVLPVHCVMVFENASKRRPIDRWRMGLAMRGIIAVRWRMSEALRSVEVVRVRGGARTSQRDCAAAEEPLEVRLHGRPFAVIMRTPGADCELAAGFLLSERVITCADDLGAIAHCTEPTADHPENIVNVTLANGSSEAIDRLLAARRQVTTTSSCGLCGRRTIDSLAVDVIPVCASWSVPAATIAAL